MIRLRRLPGLFADFVTARLLRRSSVSTLAAIILAGLSLSYSGKAYALEFLFDYSYDAAGFFGSAGSNQRKALESAASYFEGIIGDDFDAIVPNVGAGNIWTAGFFNPGSDSRPGVLIDNLVIPANTLLIYVGASDLGGALGLAQPGNASVSGSTAWNDTVIKRGQGGIIDTSTVGNDTEVAPWGGVISFDSTVTWNFDDHTGPGATGSQVDFRTVALHELGHVLGIGTVDSFVALTTAMEFTGASAVAANGGNVPLTSDDHFANSTPNSTVFLGGGSQAPVMLGALPVGTRREFTALDAAVLDDIGYDIVPEPTSALLLFSAGISLLLRRRRRDVVV